MNGKRSLVKSNVVSLALRVLLWLSAISLIILLFYLYHEGAWRDVLRYYRFFFDGKRLRLFIASFGPYAAVVFVLVQGLQVVFAPIPGEITGFVGGFLFGKVWGVILSTIGLTLGSTLAFMITRSLGLRFVERIVKKEYIDKFNFFVTHKGLYLTFILFVIPGFPKDSLCYLLGLTRMKLLDLVLMNAFGRLPGTLMLTLQGNAVRNGKYQEFFWLLAGSVVLIIGLYFTKDYVVRFVGHLIHLRLGKKKDKESDPDPIDGKDI